MELNSEVNLNMKKSSPIGPLFIDDKELNLR
mgnify:CR=1 FL=1